MELRRATPADLPEMLRLQRQSETAAHWNRTQYEAIFSADGQVRVALMATEPSADESIIGFLIARCLADEWEIENVIVEEQQRNRGVGSSLVREVLAEAQAGGAAWVILEVRESNRTAVRLYESIGFRQDGRRRSYYRDPVEDALLLRIPLQSCDKIP